MCDLPGPGIKPASPALSGRFFLPLNHQGNPSCCLLTRSYAPGIFLLRRTQVKLDPGSTLMASFELTPLQTLPPNTVNILRYWELGLQHMILGGMDLAYSTILPSFIQSPLSPSLLSYPPSFSFHIFVHSENTYISTIYFHVGTRALG